MKNLIIILLFVNGFVSAQTTTFINTYTGGYEGWCVEQTLDSGFAIIGDASDTRDIYLVKTDNNGDTLWTKKYGGPYYDIGYSIQQTFDNGFIIAGKYGEPDTMMEGYANVYVIKTDEWGDTLWTCIMGDEGWGDYAYSVQQTSDSGYIVGGVFHYALNGGQPIAFLSKLNSNGSLLWTKTYPDFSHAYSVVQTFDGGFAFTGNYGVVKTDTEGDTIWTKKDDWGFQWVYGNEIIQTTDSCFIITGSANVGSDSDLFLCKVDYSRNVIWTKEYDVGCVECGKSIDKCTDGGFIVTGGGCSSMSIWLLRTDNNGDTIWTKNYGASNGYDLGNCVKQCSDNGFIVTGSVMNSKMFLLKTDSLGNAPALDLNIELPEKNKYKINVYPNPTPSIITVEGNCNEPYIFKLYNLFGKEIKTEIIINNKKEIDVSSLPIGIYVYMIIINDKAITSGKVIIY